MNKKINITVFPNYKDVFPDDKENDNIGYFLSNVPSINVIHFVSYISACLDNDYTNFKTQNFILKELLKPLNRKEQLEVSSKINKVSLSSPIIVFNHFSCQMILQYSILNFVQGNIPNFSADIAFNILKSFLICNSKYSKEMEMLIPGISNFSEQEKLLGLNITMDVAQNSLFNSEDDVLEQSYKLKELNDFLKIDEEIGTPYYDDYLKFKKVNNLLEIIKYSWNIHINFKSHNKNADLNKQRFIIDTSHDDESVSKYLNSISNTEEGSDNFSNTYGDSDLDFKLLRDKPLFKLDKFKYAVLSSKYYTDKIFNNLIFDYYQFIREKGYLKSFGDFKSYYSDVFVEKYLLNRIIEYTFEKINCNRKQAGDKFKTNDKKNKDYSDYYIRIGNKILLFECKDRIMKAGIKYSYDYKIVINDIEDKYINSGVKQLVKVIDSISKSKIRFDKLEKNDIESLQIIPIIVYTDYAYKSRGINFYINNIFKQKLSDLNINFQIENIIMIHIDTLINYMDLFHIKKVDIVNTLIIYNKFVNRNRKYLTDKKNVKLYSYEPYDIFLNDYILNKREVKYVEKKYIKKLYEELYNNCNKSE